MYTCMASHHATAKMEFLWQQIIAKQIKARTYTVLKSGGVVVGWGGGGGGVGIDDSLLINMSQHSSHALEIAVDCKCG